jgi:predicted permease
MDLGFDATNVAVATKRLDANVSSREGVQYIRDLRDRLAAHSGVARVAMSQSLELTLFRMSGPVGLAAFGEESAGPVEPAYHNAVTPGYLEMMGVPLLRGRTLEETDDEGSRSVAVINETFANRYWPEEDPIGRTFEVQKEVGAGPSIAARGERDARSLEVVGVTRDGTYLDFDDGAIAYFWTSLYQEWQPHFAVAVEGVQSAESMFPILRESIDLSEGEVQMIVPSALSDQISIQFIHLRVASVLLGWGGLFGLFLASIGIYGVVAFEVSRRAREMAIRIALGAERTSVLRSVALDGLRPAIVGLAIGVLIVVGLANLAKSVLFGVSPVDPLAIAGGVGTLLLVAALASVIPARRAMRIDPMGTLRSE